MDPLSRDEVVVEVRVRGGAGWVELVAVRRSPEGIEEIDREVVARTTSAPVELMEGSELESGREALDRLSNRLTGEGFELDGQADAWYARRFWRPYLPWPRLETDNTLVAALDAFIAENPYNGHALASRAHRHLRDEQYEAALRCASEVLRTGPGNVPALATAADALLRLDRPAEALTFAQRATAIAPSFDYARNTLAQAQSRLGIPVSTSAGVMIRLNTLALVALLFAFCFPPAGAILGHVARRQVKFRHEAGGRLALAAILIGWSLTVLAICSDPGYFLP